MMGAAVVDGTDGTGGGGGAGDIKVDEPVKVLGQGGTTSGRRLCIGCSD